MFDRRIRNNGHKLDGFPGLRFKAYLSTTVGKIGSSENRYAPFYLWEQTEGLDAFLSGPGFKGVTSAFGWPCLATWIVWHHHVSPEIATAGFAVLHTIPIAPHRDLQELRCEAVRTAQERTNAGASASVTGFDPGKWSQVQFSLWRDPPKNQMPGQTYDVGYVAS